MTLPPAFQSQSAPRPLPFDPSRLKGLSERLIRSHWENNYGGSVKALANVKTRLAQAAGDADLPPYVYNDLKREHLVRTGSVVLHELYFDNLGGSGRAGNGERQAIAQAFGSFDACSSNQQHRCLVYYHADGVGSRRLESTIQFQNGRASEVRTSDGPPPKDGPPDKEA